MKAFYIILLFSACFWACRTPNYTRWSSISSIDRNQPPLGSGYYHTNIDSFFAGTLPEDSVNLKDTIGHKHVKSHNYPSGYSNAVGYYAPIDSLRAIGYGTEEDSCIICHKWYEIKIGVDTFSCPKKTCFLYHLKEQLDSMNKTE